MLGPLLGGIKAGRYQLVKHTALVRKANPTETAFIKGFI